MVSINMAEVERGFEFSLFGKVSGFHKKLSVVGLFKFFKRVVLSFVYKIELLPIKRCPAFLSLGQVA